MTAVLSANDHDFYSYPLPIVVWTWEKLGIKTIVFTPNEVSEKINLAKKYCGSAQFFTFDCDDRKSATYSQTSRLFGATVVTDEDEILVVGDADLAVFGDEFSFFNKNEITVLGGDLLSEETGQYPMCFIAMSAKKWKDVFCLHGQSLQEALDGTVGRLESINFRGDFWSYDQWLACQTIKRSNHQVNIIKRGKYPEMFATRRCDRDNYFWEQDLSGDLIDAHLWRPGYTEENFQKILRLLLFFYPQEDFTWLIEYNSAYKKLL